MTSFAVDVLLSSKLQAITSKIVFGRPMFGGSYLNINFELDNHIHISEWIRKTISNLEKTNTTTIINIIDQIWIARNIMVFENNEIPTK